MAHRPGSSTVRQFRTLFEGGTVAALTDGQLLERFVEGRDEGREVAFAALVARHGPMVLGVCRRALADPDDAADAFQATFLILVKKARSVRVDDSLGRWLYGVSRKVAGRARVIAKRRPKAEAGAIDAIAAHAPDPDRFELLAILDDELGRLPEAFRSAIVLCDLEGMTHEEAARDLLIPVGTIKSRLTRGRRKLRERLERRGLNPSALALAPIVPAALAEATARLAWMSALVGSPSAGMVPSASVVLAQEVLKAMTGFKLKLAAAAVLSLGVAATGAGVMARGQDGNEGRVAAVAKKVDPTFVGALAGIKKSSRLLIEVLGGDQVKLEGKAMALEGLTDALKASNGADDPSSMKVHLLASNDQRYSDVVRVVHAIQEAGTRDIRFDPAGSMVEAKLDKPVSLTISDRPLFEVVNQLRDQTGLTIVLDMTSFHRAGLTKVEVSRVTFAAKDLPLRKVLKFMLRPFDLTYHVDGNTLFITTTRGPILESLQADLESYRKWLATAEGRARDSQDPSVVMARREIAGLEAEIDKINKASSDKKDSADPSKPKRVEALGRVTMSGREQAAKQPRELAKVSMPEYVVEPPDIINVEVLKALPDRPITGERLVRPDGSISLGYYGEVTVTGLKLAEIKEKVILHLLQYLDEETLGLSKLDPQTGKKVRPALSDRVFVMVSSYNSKVYYVQGDVGVPGRLPITGNETVLDGINYAGGLIPSSAKANIVLVRPATPGAQGGLTLPVDLDAIVNRGDATTNYQIFPGDRLIVYRDPKFEPAGIPAAKPEEVAPADVEARLQAVERKLDEVLKALERSPKP